MHKCTKSCEVNHRSLYRFRNCRNAKVHICLCSIGITHFKGSLTFLDCFLLLLCREGACPDLNNLHEATNNTEFLYIIIYIYTSMHVGWKSILQSLATGLCGITVLKMHEVLYGSQRSAPMVMYVARILQSLVPAGDIINVTKPKKHGDSPHHFLYTIKYYLP